MIKIRTSINELERKYKVQQLATKHLFLIVNYKVDFWSRKFSLTL